MNISTPGALGPSATGTTLSSEETGGVNAIVAVVATGTSPDLLFGAAQLTGPAGSIGGATKMISYTSLGGASQAYTAGTSSYSMNRLIDTFVVKGKATNTDGFVSGTYAVAATITCQQ